MTIDNSINNLRIPIIRDQGKKNIITYFSYFYLKYNFLMIEIEGSEISTSSLSLSSILRENIS